MYKCYYYCCCCIGQQQGDSVQLAARNDQTLPALTVRGPGKFVYLACMHELAL